MSKLHILIACIGAFFVGMFLTEAWELQMIRAATPTCQICPTCPTTTTTTAAPLKTSDCECLLRSNVWRLNDKKNVTEGYVEKWMSERRNRWTVHSFAAVQHAVRKPGLWESKNVTRPFFCFAMLTNQRVLPFELLTLGSLFGNAKKDLLESVVYVLNCDRTLKPYPEMELLSRIPFVKIVDMPQRDGDPQGDRDKALKNQFEDYIEAMRLCRSSNAQYSIILESGEFVKGYMF